MFAIHARLSLRSQFERDYHASGHMHTHTLAHAYTYAPNDSLVSMIYARRRIIKWQTYFVMDPPLASMIYTIERCACAPTTSARWKYAHEWHMYYVIMVNNATERIYT